MATIENTGSTGSAYYRTYNWKNILFFGITTLLALIGVPFYAYFVGFSGADWALFFFMCFVTMMSTTLGYHRLFAHRAFKAHPFLEFLCLFFGAAAFEQSVLSWASQHRDHHRFTDTDRDPYNIKKGFWHAHMGWFLFYTYDIDYSNVRDLSSNPTIKYQHDVWIWWAIAAGIALPLAIGLAGGHLWGALFLGVLGRLVVIHQSVFLINSAAHMFGKKSYDGTQTASDSWFCALLTNGEGYHNFHHAFPNDYRNGIRWYQWDPTKWFIKALSWCGMTTDLRKTPEPQIIEARIAEKQQNFVEVFAAARHPKIVDALQNINVQYEKVRECLKHWEVSFTEYRRVCREDSGVRLAQVAGQMEDARKSFFEAYGQWMVFIRQKAQLLQIEPAR